jgi:hypothetical protein
MLLVLSSSIHKKILFLRIGDDSLCVWKKAKARRTERERKELKNLMN